MATEEDVGWMVWCFPFFRKMGFSFGFTWALLPFTSCQLPFARGAMPTPLLWL